MRSALPATVLLDSERDVFLANVERFLGICDGHGIAPGFVFFDDCHRHDGIFLDAPTAPVKGWHNGRWAACPQDRDRDAEDLEKLRPYVQEVVRAHRADRRVLWWEVFNEPRIRKGNYSERLRRAAYRWARDVGPVQPVISCWDDNEATDIVDAHAAVAERRAPGSSFDVSSGAAQNGAGRASCQDRARQRCASAASGLGQGCCEPDRCLSLPRAPAARSAGWTPKPVP